MRRRKSTAVSSRSRSNSNYYNYFPEEIFIEILLRLPVKSLLRFRSVCKSWCSLIDSPSFTTTHLNHQITSNRKSYLLLRYKSQRHNNGCYSIRRDDKSFCEYFEPKLPVDFNYLLGIYGSCNGLVCLSDDYMLFQSTIFLWNPALRKLKTLPNSQIHVGFVLNCSVFLAFGFHARFNDYKVVRIVYFHKEMNPLGEVEVYNLSTDSWRRIGAVAPSCYIIARPSVFMNGAAYWIAHRKTDEGTVYFIVSFDMGDEVFEEVPLPDSARHTYPLIAVMGESLYLLHFDRSAHNECCDVWVLECSTTGWAKRYTTDLRDVIGMQLGIQDVIWMQLGFRKNGELLLVNRNEDLVSYNLEIQQAKDLGIHVYPMTFCVHSYIESLVLFDGGNRLSVLANSCDAVIHEETSQEADGIEGQHQAKISKEARKERKKR